VTAEEFKRRRDVIENGIDASKLLIKRNPKSENDQTKEEIIQGKLLIEKKKKKKGNLSFENEGEN
jgi:hypothetical protein